LINIVDPKERRVRKKANISKMLERPYLTNMLDLKVKGREKRVEENSCLPTWKLSLLKVILEYPYRF
jgi:hypothetical protein